MAEINFNATEYDPRGGFEALPNGEYRVQIIDTEIKENRKGTGDLLVLELEVLEGEFKGQRIWDNLNINNQSAKASEIARSKLSLICHLVGQLQLPDTQDLRFKPLLAVVEYRGQRIENGVTYNASNRVTTYRRDPEQAEGAAPLPQITQKQAQADHDAQLAERARTNRNAPIPGKVPAPVDTTQMPWRRARG